MTYQKQTDRWLKEHGLTEEQCKEHGVTVSPLSGFIHFKMFDEESMRTFRKARSFRPQDPKYIIPTGMKALLYGKERIKTSENIIITEGEAQVVLLATKGYASVSGTAGATTFKPEWVELLKDKNISLCMDNDPAGARSTYKLISMIPSSVKVLFIREKDLCEEIVVHGTWQSELTFPLVHEKAKQKRARQILKVIHFARQNKFVTPHSDEWWSTFLEEAQKEYKQLKYKKKKQGTDKNRETNDLRNIPIENVLEFNGQGFAQCLWHNESTPSLHKIPNSPLAKCFGCGKVVNVIDAIMARDNITFLEALEKLKNI